MKIKNIILGTMFAGLAASAIAQTTDITITGATAFQGASLKAIYDAYASEGALGTSFFVCHSANGSTESALQGSTNAVFKGKFPGITGTTYIRTSFTGSAEGLNAIAGNETPAFLQQSAVNNATTAILGSVTTPTETLRPKFSFSDVYQSTTPVDNVTLNPSGSSAVGVVAFCMVANEGAPASLTNVTTQQARRLWTNGMQKLSLFTGNASDTSYVFATGRNDGSGTRAVYLSEWGMGVATLVNQYIATSTGTTSTAITKITAVPENGLGSGNFTTSGATNASTLWGNTAVGNGGYNSSSSLRTLMGLTSANVTVYDGVNQDPLYENQNIYLLAWVSSAHALTISTNGGKILSYNGVGVTPIASAGSYLNSGFSQADFGKIASGAYSAWSYQHLYYWGALSANEQIWYNAMKNTWIPAGLALVSNGLKLTDLNVSRSDDGAPIVAPL